jgi:hypothetical protein
VLTRLGARASVARLDALLDGRGEVRPPVAARHELEGFAHPKMAGKGGVVARREDLGATLGRDVQAAVLAQLAILTLEPLARLVLVCGARWLVEQPAHRLGKIVALGGCDTVVAELVAQ